MPVMKVASPAFDQGTRIPKKYTGEGEDISPPIAWHGAPAGTREFAMIVEDPDAPRPDPWVHWVVYGIPASRTSFPEGSAPGATEGVNTGGQVGYAGPMPPEGHGVHHYHFRLYALNAAINLRQGATKQELLAAMKGHIIAEGELVGTYERRRITRVGPAASDD